MWPASPASAWAPPRRVFRALWMAQFAANLGTWAQTVGAQWLMGDLTGNDFAVALVQAATTLPVFLLVVPAGALGDVFDRRRLLLAGQLMMFVGAAGLAVLTAAERTTPVLLLLSIALMGTGRPCAFRRSRRSSPSWSARKRSRRRRCSTVPTRTSPGRSARHSAAC
jgi:hypothetical protein